MSHIQTDCPFSKQKFSQFINLPLRPTKEREKENDRMNITRGKHRPSLIHLNHINARAKQFLSAISYLWSMTATATHKELLPRFLFIIQTRAIQLMGKTLKFYS